MQPSESAPGAEHEPAARPGQVINEPASFILTGADDDHAGTSLTLHANEWHCEV